MPRLEAVAYCENGHHVSFGSFCPKCGAPVVDACRTCDIPILKYSNFSASSTPPAYCRNCGKAFLWTERALAAARELAAQSDLSDDELKTFGESIDELTKDTPMTALPATRVKQLLIKAGPVIGEAIRKTVVDIVSESTKEMAGL